MINFKLDKTPKIKTLDENEIFKMSESIMMFMAVFESMDNRLKKKDTAYFGKEIMPIVIIYKSIAEKKI